MAVAAWQILERDADAAQATAELERLRDWTHQMMFPHVGGVPAEFAAEADIHREALERGVVTPLVRPAAAWTSPPAGAAPPRV